MAKPGHKQEHEEIRLVAQVMFNSSTEWYKLADFRLNCGILMDVVHDSCIRLVLKKMVKQGKCEYAIKDGNYVYRRNTALSEPHMVPEHARKRHIRIRRVDGTVLARTR